jgi:tetratricopeptide (TPR) repeat protein
MPNHPRGETTYLINNAVIDLYLEDYAAAQERFQRALQIASHNQPWAEGFALINLGKTKLHLGEYSNALALLQQGQATMREMGDVWQQAQALGWLARLATCLGSYAQAQTYLDQFSEITGPTESPEVVYLGEFARARLALARGEFEQALAHVRRADGAAQRAQHPINAAIAFTLVGHSYLGLCQFNEATDAYQQALTLYATVGQTRLAAEAQAGLAAVALGQNDLMAAMAQVEALLNVVADHPQQVGLDAPFNIYLTCYRVLKANHDARASHVLQTAHQLLQRYADHIADESLRRSFLNNAPVFDEVLA